MTITEIEPDASAAPVAVREAMAPAVYQRLPKNILADSVSSGDHKVIGRLWILGSLLFGLFTLVADVLVRIERVDTDSVAVFTSLTTYEQWFSMHRVSLVFLFVVPLLIGIAMVMCRCRSARHRWPSHGLLPQRCGRGSSLAQS